MKNIRVYLDNCCYNRPYDDQTQIRISLEAQAKLEIQELIKKGEIELATSYWTEYENANNPIEIRRESIKEFQNKYAYLFVKETLDLKIFEIANKIEKTGIKHKDACHVASAIISESNFFISTDDRLLKYKTDYIEMVTPIEFINKWEDIKNGNEY